jgi:hypothetical protein
MKLTVTAWNAMSPLKNLSSCAEAVGNARERERERERESERERREREREREREKEKERETMISDQQTDNANRAKSRSNLMEIVR